MRCDQCKLISPSKVYCDKLGFLHQGVATSMKPHLTRKRMLVHPKDKRTPQENVDVVCQVPYKDCPCVYTGGTERRYGVREKEHKRDVKTLEKKRYTRYMMEDSLTEVHPSAIMDHIAKANHSINWEGVKFPARDTDWTAREVKDAVEIRNPQGHHQLPSLYSKLLVKQTSPFVTESIHQH